MTAVSPMLVAAILVACSTVTLTPTPAAAAVPAELSALARELRDLPDNSAAMAQAYRTERERLDAEPGRAAWFTARVPAVQGHVAEIFGDRVAVMLEDQAVPPRESSFLAVCDTAGLKADVFVIRVRGSIVLGQTRRMGSGARIRVGDRVTGDLR